MSPLVDSKRAEVSDLCRRFRVRRLDLFGSAATGHFQEATSDLDFLVGFEAMPAALHTASCFGLKEGLEALFGRPVDLVTANAVVNPYFRESVAASRVPVYAA